MKKALHLLRGILVFAAVGLVAAAGFQIYGRLANFDRTGMIVGYTYTEGYRELPYTDNFQTGPDQYTITDGTNLAAGRDRVSIAVHDYEHGQLTTWPVLITAEALNARNAPVGTTLTFGTLYLDWFQIQPGRAALYNSGDDILFKDSDGANDLTWVKVSDTMLIPIVTISGIKWSELNSLGFVSGRRVTIDGYTYTIRLMTGGATSAAAGTSEWNAYVVANGDSSYWRAYNYYWCSERYSGDATQAVQRGDYYTVNTWTSANIDQTGAFRPILVIE